MTLLRSKLRAVMHLSIVKSVLDLVQLLRLRVRHSDIEQPRILDEVQIVEDRVYARRWRRGNLVQVLCQKLSLLLLLKFQVLTVSGDRDARLGIIIVVDATPIGIAGWRRQRREVPSGNRGTSHLRNIFIVVNVISRERN